MLRHILGSSLAKAEIPATLAKDGFQIGDTDILTVKNNVAVFNQKTIGKHCLPEDNDGLTSFNCVGANIYAIAGAENKLTSAVNNGGEYHITMTYTDDLASSTETIEDSTFDLEYQLAANEIHFDNMYTENYIWTLNGQDPFYSDGEELVNGKVWNMRITDNFTKVELGYKQHSNPDYLKRWVHAEDDRWAEGDLKWVTIGLNCSQPQLADRKDEFTVSGTDGSIFDCYVAENVSGQDNRHLWTRIEIHRNVSEITKPHAKMTGLGATKFGIDIYLPTDFDLSAGIPIDSVVEYWAVEEGNGGEIGDSKFQSHWGHTDDSNCSKNPNPTGGLYASSLDDLITRSNDEDANYKLRYGIQLAQGTLALQWNNTTYKNDEGGKNAWLDIIPLWSVDFASCTQDDNGDFCDHIETIEWVSGYVLEDLVMPTPDNNQDSGFNTPIIAKKDCTPSNVYKCVFNNETGRIPVVSPENKEPEMPEDFTGEGTAYVKIEMADPSTNSMFRYDTGNVHLAAMKEVYDEGTSAYTSYSSVYIRNCYLNDISGYDSDLYLTEENDINCSPTPEDSKTGMWTLSEADINLKMIPEVLIEASFWIRRDQNFTTTDGGAEFYFGAAKEEGAFTLAAASYKVAGAEIKNTQDWTANCVVDGKALTCTKGSESFKLNVVNDVHRKYHAAAIENNGGDYVLYINTCATNGFQMADGDYGSDVIGGGSNTSATTTAAPSKGKGKSNVGVIVGSIFGVLAVGAAGGGTYYFVKKRGTGSDAPDRVTADDYKNSNIAFETNYTAEVEIFDKDYFDDSV